MSQKSIGLVLVLVGLTGCATTGMNTSTGAGLISNFKESYLATNAAGASKTGKACSQNYVGVAAVGDSSIEAAKKNGGISTVSSIDKEITNILFIYGQSCTIVKGN